MRCLSSKTEQRLCQQKKKNDWVFCPGFFGWQHLVQNNRYGVYSAKSY